MRYLFVLVCFAVVLSATACTFDDGTEPNEGSKKAVAGEDLVIDIGVARLEISGLAIGTGAGQLPPGTEVILKIDEDEDLGSRTAYSPVVKVLMKDDNGDSVTGVTFSPAATLELSYDHATASADGAGGSFEITLLKIDGSTNTELSLSPTVPVLDTSYVVPYSGRVRAQVSTLDRFVVAESETIITPPSATALTGTTSTVLTQTLFQLADVATVFSVTVAVPTADTTTPPTVVTLNDASFDAGNPLDPTNRAVTVQTGGVTFTSDDPSASVVFQLDTFTGTSSSGSLLGTVIEQGGSQSLQINFTFTTGAVSAMALGGTVTDLGTIRTITLQDAAQTEQVTILMPDTFPNGALDPVTFDDSTFDAANPTDPTGRIITVNANNETFSSDVPVVGSVTVTFTSWDDLTLVGQGTITGTVVSATPNTKTLNYTFDTTAGAGGGGGTFTAGTPVDVTTTDVADQCAVAFDTADYVAVWLSDVDTTNRTLEYIFLDPDTLAGSGANSYEPTVALDPDAGFAFASNDVADTVLIGADGTDAATATVTAVFYDPVFDNLYAEVNLGTGSAPRVAYHFNEDLYVIAWQAGTDVMVGVFENDGTQVGTSVMAFTGATLTGVAAPNDTTDEAMITADDGSGIVGQFVTVSTGILAGTNFDVSTTLNGGLAVWDEVGSQYLVITQTLIFGFFVSQNVTAVASGTGAIVGTNLTLAAATSPTHVIGGDAGVIYSDGSANLYPVESSGTGAELVANPLFGAANGLDIDTTADGPAVGAAGTNRYVIVAARGAAGVTAIPLTLTP